VRCVVDPTSVSGRARSTSASAASRRPRVERRLGGAAQAPAARRLVLGEVGGALEGHRRGGMCRARDRLRRRPLERAGERLVGRSATTARCHAPLTGSLTAAASVSWASRRSLRVAAR
jgi:hypothetical protein